MPIIEELSPDGKRLMEAFSNLHGPDGVRLTPAEYAELGHVFDQPEKHWARVKHLVIATNLTLEDCVKAVVPNYHPSMIPSPAQLDEAVMYAAS